MNNCAIVEKCSTTIEFIGYSCLLPTICGLGTVFNLANLIIFTRSSFRCKIAPCILVYLTGLAVADGFAAFILLPIGPTRCFDMSSLAEKTFWHAYQMIVFLPIGNSLAMAGILITLIIAAERCMMVTKKTTINTKEPSCPKKARMILIVVFISSFCFNIPFIFYYDHVPNMEDSDFILSSFAQSIWFDIYSWVRLVCVKLLPLILVATFNIIIVNITWRNHNRVNSLGGFQPPCRDKRNDSQHKMTKMLLSIAMVFLITRFLEPFIHPSIYTSMFGTCSEHSTSYNVLLIIANVAESISFASNFVSYCVFNHQFVITLRALLGCASTTTTHVKVLPRNEIGMDLQPRKF